MRILRGFLYVLLILIVIGWCSAWFVGRYIIASEVTPRVTTLDAGGFVYTAEDYRVGGFPFSYAISPQGATLVDKDSPDFQLSPDDQLSARVSIPGSLWAYVSGRALGPRIDLRGTHDLGKGLILTVGQGWVQPNLSGLSDLTSGQPRWVFDSLDANLRDVSLSANGRQLVRLDQLALDMTLLGEGKGYAYDFDLIGLASGGAIFQNVPNQIDLIRLQGELHPEANSDLIALAQEVQTNPLGALASYGQAIAQLLASEPGLFIDTGTVRIGDAQINMDLDMPFNFRLSAQSASLDISGQVSGTNFMGLLQNVLREPAARQSGLAAPVAAFMAFASSYGIDLETGQPSQIEGSLIEMSRAGLRPFGDGLTINGRALAL